MWRDILIILAFAFAALTYFGVTPRRISSYAKTAKVKVAQRGLLERISLLCVIVISLYTIFLIISKFEETHIVFILSTGIFLILLWGTFLTDVWKLSEKAEKILYIVVTSLISPLGIAMVVLMDMPFWQRIVLPIIGLSIGAGIALLRVYLIRKSKK
jgi:hypothetical protein